MHDWDYLDYLSLLSPKGTLGSGGRGGMPQVTREDVLAALAGIDPLSELLVYARLGMLSSVELADKSVDAAFLAAFSARKRDMAQFSMEDFSIVWRVACVNDSRAEAVWSEAALMRVAGVSNHKWARLRVMYPICCWLIAAAWDSVRRALGGCIGNRLIG